jgi:hypothetical protein
LAIRRLPLLFLFFGHRRPCLPRDLPVTAGLEDPLAVGATVRAVERVAPPGHKGLATKGAGLVVPDLRQAVGAHPLRITCRNGFHKQDLAAVRNLTFLEGDTAVVFFLCFLRQKVLDEVALEFSKKNF